MLECLKPNSISSSAFIALNLCSRADSKVQQRKRNSIFLSRDMASATHNQVYRWRLCLVLEVCLGLLLSMATEGDARTSSDGAFHKVVASNANLSPNYVLNL